MDVTHNGAHSREHPRICTQMAAWGDASCAATAQALAPARETTRLSRLRISLARTRAPSQHEVHGTAACTGFSAPSIGRREVCQTEQRRNRGVSSDPLLTKQLRPPSRHHSAGVLVALLNDAGRLYVTSPDLRTLLCEFDTTPHGEPASVLSFAWCGADAVVLHWPDALLLVGPIGDALRFPLDASAAVATECDSLRVFTGEQHLLLRRVPEALARCLGVGSTASGALLADALDAFDKGSSRAEEALRAVGPALQDAASDCAAAALHAWDPAQQRALLRASAFGTAHVPLSERSASITAAALGAPGTYAQACRTLRVLNAVRHHVLGGIPLTAAQYAALPGGPGALLTRLLAARRHLLALRLCEYLGTPPARVLLHWAAAKMGAAVALSDRQLLDVLMDKLRGVPGIPFGDVASEAFRRGRPRLAALLLDYEQRSGEQVPLLTSMGEDDRALAKAVESGDTDLVYLALFSLYRKQPSFATFAECVARRPEARALFVAYCRRTDAELLKSFLYAVGDAAATADAVLREALTGLALSPPSQGALDPGVVAKLLEQSGELYTKCKHDFAAWAVTDSARLLKVQLDLEYADASRSRGARAVQSGGSRFVFVGRSLAFTVLATLVDGNTKMAAKLRSDFKMSDKHWAWLRARAAVARSDWDSLASLAEEKKPPMGHVALVELALDAGAPRLELARLIARVGDASSRAELYTAAGLAQQAEQAAAEAAEQQGSSYAKQAQNLLTQTLGRLTLGGN